MTTLGTDQPCGLVAVEARCRICRAELVMPASSTVKARCSSTLGQSDRFTASAACRLQRAGSVPVFVLLGRHGSGPACELDPVGPGRWE